MNSYKYFSVVFTVILISSCDGSNKSAKRGIYEGNFGGAFNGHEFNFGGFSQTGAIFHQPSPQAYAKQIVVQKIPVFAPSISSAEIASAIAAAKEASAQVHQAQHRVQAAKEAVLHQQRIANQKESQAAIAVQKAEAAAAVQRQEANAAATAVVLAQQRLAQAKADVSEQQRIASAKEAHAAQIIQKSASAAAAEIEKSEHTAAKLDALQKSGADVYKQATANKEATLSAASAAVAASASHYPAIGPDAHPWYPQAFTIGSWQ